MSERTFMQAIYDGALKVVDTELGKAELSGVNREQFIASVKAITDGMSQLPLNTNLHVALLAVTYVRNAILAAIQLNQNRLMVETGGSA